MTIPWYALMLVAGLTISAVWWGKRFRSEPVMIVVYMAGLLGALIGAKLGYFVAELPYEAGQPHFWLKAATGKTILGALLGGYGGVEAGKWLIGYQQATGDVFAVVVPVGLALGRVGCLLHGCCLGIECPRDEWWTMTGLEGLPHWPAQVVEMIFNLTMAAVLFTLWRRERQRGQLFHIYLIAYGAFRFVHEWLRQTPRLTPWLSTYQLLAVAVLVLGVWRYVARSRALATASIAGPQRGTAASGLAPHDAAEQGASSTT